MQKMIAHRFTLSLIALTLCVMGCAAHDRTPMTYEQCANARYCTVSGVVTARPAEHAWMGQLALPDGKCVGISLPEAVIESLRRNGPREMTVGGRVYGDPSVDREVAWMEIQGRRIGLGLCGDFFVFVRDGDVSP